jgi:ribosomal protein S12 methylthiotransferase
MIAWEICIGGFDMGYNIGMVSLGCDKNRVDAEVMLSRLKERGYNIVNEPQDADIIIVNTCGFIESAKEESIDTILEMAQNKKNGRCKGVIATGCMAQRYSKQLMEEMPELDAVVGTGSYADIADVADEIIRGSHSIIRTGELNYNLDYEKRIISTPSHYAYIKIAEGCSNNCTYCIIPKLRGRFRSRTMESIVKEAEELSKAGIKELIVVAQDTTMYGRDIYGRKALPELLRKLECVDGIQWIRILYSYPEEITDELIDTIANSSKICHYFDIPLQHVSNNVLKTMNRRNTYEETIALINKLRASIPDVIIRTTFIVGFPGESQEDFQQLYSFIQDYKLDRVGIFTYSQEEDTPAAVMENQIEEKTKEERKNLLMKLQRRIVKEKNRSYIGKTLDVMIDEEDNEGIYYGRTYGDAPDIDQQVIIKDFNGTLQKGDIIRVRIKDTYTYDLLGDVEK